MALSATSKAIRSWCTRQGADYWELMGITRKFAFTLLDEIRVTVFNPPDAAMKVRQLLDRRTRPSHYSIGRGITST
ncbi:MAG: hypothetical protein JWL90_2087 [Chthoniobacteraceae bacterium]|nr:hypothetical protein [Chthoniobacteraceae bacterium]